MEITFSATVEMEDGSYDNMEIDYLDILEMVSEAASAKYGNRTVNVLDLDMSVRLNKVKYRHNKEN